MRLGEAVAAYRAALEERTQERVPLQWATTQNNLTVYAREPGPDTARRYSPGIDEAGVRLRQVETKHMQAPLRRSRFHTVCLRFAPAAGRRTRRAGRSSQGGETPVLRQNGALWALHLLPPMANAAAEKWPSARCRSDTQICGQGGGPFELPGL